MYGNCILLRIFLSFQSNSIRRESWLVACHEIWLFGYGYGYYVVVGKCFAVIVAVCECFEVVD